MAARNFTFYGVRGVQLFFIVSGMTLSISHMGRPFDLPNFAARRFFRIAPMFYAGAVIYFILGMATPLKFETQHATLGEVLTTLAFLQSWSIEHNNKVVPGSWSIGAEAMFYVVFPIILIRLREPRSFAFIVIGLYILAGVTNLSLRKLTPGDPAVAHGFAFSFWVCQLPAFATGCLLAAVAGEDLLSVKAARIVAFLSALAIVADSQMPGRTNLLISVILLSTLTWAFGRAPPAWLEGNIMPLIGEVSFSVYILHFAVVSVLELAAPRLEATFGWAPTLIFLYCATLILTLPLAAATYCFVEKPFIRFGRGALHRLK